MLQRGHGTLSSVRMLVRYMHEVLNIQDEAVFDSFYVGEHSQPLVFVSVTYRVHPFSDFETTHPIAMRAISVFTPISSVTLPLRYAILIFIPVSIDRQTFDRHQHSLGGLDWIHSTGFELLTILWPTMLLSYILQINHALTTSSSMKHWAMWFNQGLSKPDSWCALLTRVSDSLPSNISYLLTFK